MSIDLYEDSKKLLTLLAQEPTDKEAFATSAVHTEPTKVDFPLLEDTNHRVIDRYGLLNPQGKGWLHPATYVIDRGGKVRWKFVEVDYTVRATNDRILKALKPLL